MERNTQKEMPGQPDFAQSGSLGPFIVGQTGEVPRLASESVPCLPGGVLGLTACSTILGPIGHPELDKSSQVN